MSKIIASTENNDNLSHYVGFHDICPWNETNEMLAIQQAVKDDIKYRTKDDFVSIVLWKPSTSEKKVIDETNCWNWQQGSRLQWIPKSNKIIYNKRKNNKAISQIYDAGSNAFKETLDYPIYELHPSGQKAISYSFSRLGHLWKGYGYAELESDSDINEVAPTANGIFEVDLNSNTKKLIVSLADTFKISRNEKFDGFRRFFTHCSYNPSGTKFCFFERFHTEEGALYSRFFVANSDGTDLQLISEGKQSHFDWYDDSHILIWSRPSKSLMNVAHKLGILGKPPFKQMIKLIRGLNPSLKTKMTNEYYRLIDLSGTDDERAIAKDVVKEDGHPMFNGNRDLFVNDTYPNAEGQQELMLIAMATNSKISLGWFDVPSKFQDNDLKCDLHPRWNRDFTQLCIDSSHSGRRQVYIIDVNHD